MACDNLRPATFNKAMSSIKDEFDALVPAFNKFKAVTDEMKKEGWHTPAGYDDINMLANRVRTSVENCCKVIFNNYNEMKRSAKQFAQKEKMSINVREINLKKIPEIKDAMGADDDGFVDDDVLGSKSTPLGNAKKDILEHLKTIKTVTGSEESFGYWSTGSNDPREAINHSASHMYSRVEQIIDTWNNDLWDRVQTDKADRENAKKGTYENFGE